MSTRPLRVWLVDDDASIRWVLEKALKAGGMLPKVFEAAEAALDALRGDAPDVLVTDIRMPGMSGLELVRKIHQTRPQLPIIVMTAHADLDNAVSAYESGAFEYLPKPFDIDQVIDLVKRAAQSMQRNVAGRSGDERMPELLGKAPAMQQVFRAIGRLSRSAVTVLITGESGTGKELV
ncbi:MAG: response regulator, partial [Gammaproteobacteria bacterium]|nr:response regulator [Gammaproteobacteria bacterium]